MTDKPVKIETNDDLYQAIVRLTPAHEQDPERSLETYLLALLGACLNHWTEQQLTPEAFVELLGEAFTSTPAEFDSGWEDAYRTDWLSLRGWERFQAIIQRQIVDLKEMRAHGLLTNQYIDMGIQSPKGGTWYNFDIQTYLECACAGNFDGWSPDDDVLFNPPQTPIQGNITIQDIQEELTPLPPITWEQFADFLYCGQIHK